jgi:hypothetical protein
MNKPDMNLILVSIVAVVAIVGIIVMITSTGTTNNLQYGTDSVGGVARALIGSEKTISANLNNKQVNPSIKPLTQCNDSDNGINYNVKGTTIAGRTSKTDFCRNYNSNTLVEYYCKNNQVVSENHKCPNGCKNGVCKEISVKPVCGDRILSAGEKCEPGLPFSAVCSDFNEFEGGLLTCNQNCQFNTSGCYETLPAKCGNGICEAGEAAICLVCTGQPCPMMPCAPGTCPQDCGTNNFNSLSAYPEFLFDDINDLTSFKGQLVIGQYAPTSDVMVALDIATSLFHMNVSGNDTVPLNPIAVGVAVLDNEASYTKPSLIIDGPCVNILAAWHLDNPANCANGYVTGIGRLDFLQKEGQTAIMVSGYTVDDIKNAKNVLVNWRQYEASFGNAKSICIKQISLNEVSVYECDPLPKGTDCGDGVLQAGEECEIGRPSTVSCMNFGFYGGTLTCNQNCQFDLSQCVSD